MLTRDQLLKRVTRDNMLETLLKHNAIKLKKNVTVLMLAKAAAAQDALNLNTAVPKCFGVLYDLETECSSCKLKDYCEIVFLREPKASNIIAEHDLQEDAPFGFRDGSRAATLIKAWKTNHLTKGELRELSRTQFKSLIDIERILAELRKRNLLIHDGQYFGIRRSTT
jgi:hypothetical protein